MHSRPKGDQIGGDGSEKLVLGSWSELLSLLFSTTYFEICEMSLVTAYQSDTT